MQRFTSLLTLCFLAAVTLACVWGIIKGLQVSKDPNTELKEHQTGNLFILQAEYPYNSVHIGTLEKTTLTLSHPVPREYLDKGEYRVFKYAPSKVVVLYNLNGAPILSEPLQVNSMGTLPSKFRDPILEATQQEN